MDGLTIENETGLRGALSHDLLSDRVYSLLRRAIIDGSQPPGSRLVESELARNLGVSQAPVREALKKLVYEGMVTSLPRRGSYVTVPSADEFAVGRELRASTEKLAAEHVTRLADPVTMAKLRSIAEQMIAVATRKDHGELRVLDINFHATVLEAAATPLLSRVWSILEPNLVSQRVLGDPSTPYDSVEIALAHVGLVDELESGDVARAGEAFLQHALGQTGFSIVAE